LPYDSETPLLDIYPTELKAGTQTDICTPMFMAESLTITKRWKKQSKYLSLNNWINKMSKVNITHTYKCYSALK
jgi:hypothetical protein